MRMLRLVGLSDDGQNLVLARYPIHWHLVGEGAHDRVDVIAVDRQVQAEDQRQLEQLLGSRPAGIAAAVHTIGRKQHREDEAVAHQVEPEAQKGALLRVVLAAAVFVAVFPLRGGHGQQEAARRQVQARVGCRGRHADAGAVLAGLVHVYIFFLESVA